VIELPNLPMIQSSDLSIDPDGPLRGVFEGNPQEILHDPALVLECGKNQLADGPDG